MTNEELLDRYDRTRDAFRKVACHPTSVPGWGHTQECHEWHETLRLIRERFPNCEYASSQAEHLLGRSVDAPRS
jgi:hypothetical protein